MQDEWPVHDVHDEPTRRALSRCGSILAMVIMIENNAKSGSQYTPTCHYTSLCGCSHVDHITVPTLPEKVLGEQSIGPSDGVSDRRSDGESGAPTSGRSRQTESSNDQSGTNAVIHTCLDR